MYNISERNLVKLTLRKPSALAAAFAAYRSLTTLHPSAKFLYLRIVEGRQERPALSDHSNHATIQAEGLACATWQGLPLLAIYNRYVLFYPSIAGFGPV